MAAKTNQTIDASTLDLATALADWWDENAETNIDDPLDPDVSDTTVLELQPTMDSLRAVEALLVVEEMLGQKVPVTVIKTGGYASREEFLEDLVSRLVEEFPELD